MTADGVDVCQYHFEPVIGTMAVVVDIVGEPCESSGERRSDDMNPSSCIEHSSCGDGQVVNLGHGEIGDEQSRSITPFVAAVMWWQRVSSVPRLEVPFVCLHC